MKNLKFGGKLRLNKFTISHLNPLKMGDVNGGRDVDTAGICPSPDPLPTAGHYNTCDVGCTAPSLCDSYTGNPQSNPCCPTC